MSLDLFVFDLLNLVEQRAKECPCLSHLVLSSASGYFFVTLAHPHFVSVVVVVPSSELHVTLAIQIG